MIKAVNVEQIVSLQGKPISILKDINLQVQQGESVAILGASGSGKSTLLGLLAGLDRPSAGDIFIDEHNITEFDEEKRAAIRAEYVAFIFQNFQLLPSYSALENVMLPINLKGRAKAEATALEYLDHVGLSHRAKHKPNQLSGGEQQRVAIARAFACQSPILFADEPTGNLDVQTGQQIAELIFDLNKTRGTTLVLVTHDLELARHCHRTVEIHGGELQNAAQQ